MIISADLVTIVIVTWNKRNDVICLLDSIQSIAGFNLKVVVVDNASTDGTVGAVKQHPLPVFLLENSENLGGSGGFNTGIIYALNNLNQKYLWLLDNDARVLPETLQNLVSVMESCELIGVAGSCVLNPEDPALIVEAGGIVDPGKATWRPHLRYHKYSDHSGLGACLEVDYVPACSALVRADVFKEIGVLDERFFLHWDDVDFCARVREAQYKVVAVVDSPVYHGVEKGYSPTGLYYDLRNALLYFSKRPGSMTRILSFFRILLNAFNLMYYFYFSGNKQVSWYICRAMKDFFQQGFGKAPSIPSDYFNSTSETHATDEELQGCEKVIVFAVGSQEDILAAIEKIATLQPEASITLAVPTDRAGAYEHIKSIHSFFKFSLARQSLTKHLKNAIQVFLKKYDYGISAGSDFAVPYAYFVRRNYIFDGKDGSFRKTKASVVEAWKILIALLFGVLTTSFMLIPALVKGTRYRSAFITSANK